MSRTLSVVSPDDVPAALRPHKPVQLAVDESVLAAVLEALLNGGLPAHPAGERAVAVSAATSIVHLVRTLTAAGFMVRGENGVVRVARAPE